MAAGTSSPDSQTLPRPDGFGTRVIEYDRYIETELSRTRRQVKSVDLASSCMLLAVAALVYLMLLALADHWLVTGGLGRAARIAAFTLLAAGTAAFAALRLVPLVMRRVNPVYAAYTIERHRPGIKNSLINFLLLRSESQRLPERMYEAMEVQAANALTSTHAEVAVDRTPIIRLLMAMVAVVFCIALYAVLSPKNPFTSFRRVVSPWSDVAPPTRVAIRDLQPGEGRGFHDQHVAVSAQIDGLRTGEPVHVRYSTVDGQVLARTVPMRVPEASYRYCVELPPDNLGLQQDLEYWIEAGDAISPHYRIKVETSPTIVVEQIEYVYPKYAELPPRKVARHGDIQALAATQVTLRAKANQLIREASIDFECDGRNDLDMRIDGTKAEVSFPLVWNEKARRAEHESYQLRFRNAEGHENPKPIRYSIEVIRDLPPEIELVEPELDPSKELLVPPGKPVTFAVQAADPDFKLAVVKFLARRGGMALVDESLLAEPRGGQFQRAYVLDLKRLEVKPGEQIEFWATADDNRQPSANHSETPHYRLRVAAADKNGQNQQNEQNQDDAKSDDKRQPKQGKSQKNESGNRRDDQQQQGDQSGEPGDQQSDEKNQSGGKRNQKQQERDNQSGDEGSQGGRGEQQGSDKSPSAGDPDQESDKQSGEGAGSGDTKKNSEKQSGAQDSGDKSQGPKRLDPERDAGKAIDEINKHFDQKEKEQEGQPNEQPRQKSDKGAQKKEGAKGGGEDGAEQRQNNAEKQSAGKQASEKQADKRPGEKQPSDQPQSGEKRSDEKQSADRQKQHGDKGQDAQKQGEPSAEGEKGESEQTGEKQQSGQKPDSKRQKRETKEQQGDQGALADKKNDKKPGAGEQGGAGGEGEEGEGEKSGRKQAAKNGKQPSAGDKQPEGSEQGVANEGDEKSEKDKSGGGKQGEAKVGDEQEKNADGETKPRDGQGGQAAGAGERDDKVKKHKGESPDQKGGDQDSKDKGEGGAGDGQDANKHGAPAPHSENKQREKKQISPDSKKGTSEDEPESASDSKRQSDSQSGQQGDRDGGGKSGGGQRSNSEGTGSAGQNSEADQGGGVGETKGKGASGEKAGDQQKSEKPTGGKSSGEKGPGTNQGKGEKSDAGQPSDSPEAADPRGHSNVSREPKANRDQQPPGERRPQDHQAGGEKKPSEQAPKSDARKEGPEGQRTPSERGGHDLRGGKQRSNPTDGGQPGPDETTPPDEADNSEPGGEDPNEAYARKATDLALDRLKDQLAKDKPDPALLEKLKWSREDVERFVEQWEKLKKSANESGPKGEAARQELDDALRSLGLAPRGASLSGGQKRDERVRNLEGRRSAPPPEYQEQWIEFNKATSRSRKR